MGRSNPVSPETPPKSKTPSSTQIRMASRLPILLLLCLIPLLASALGEEERSHEVDAPSAELQASVVKREAKMCRGKGKKGCKKTKDAAKKNGRARKKGSAKRGGKPPRTRKGNNGNKPNSDRRQSQRKKKTKKNKNRKKNTDEVKAKMCRGKGKKGCKKTKNA